MKLTKEQVVKVLDYHNLIAFKTFNEAYLHTMPKGEGWKSVKQYYMRTFCDDLFVIPSQPKSWQSVRYIHRHLKLRKFGLIDSLEFKNHKNKSSALAVPQCKELLNEDFWQVCLQIMQDQQTNDVR